MPAVQGYGLPALEALARGVPVVLHRESGVSEILRGTPWAEIIEDSSDELALAINTMVNRIRSEDLKKSRCPRFRMKLIGRVRYLYYDSGYDISG
jgi:glycosyltransferase involved in cell wall biosynthesis